VTENGKMGKIRNRDKCSCKMNSKRRRKIGKISVCGKFWRLFLAGGVEPVWEVSGEEIRFF
jgi:hypothetical protein